MSRRLGSNALDLELQDAYWELPGGDYVPESSTPSVLLEDSDKLDSSWTATVQSLRNELTEADDVRTRIAQHVEAFNARHGSPPANAAATGATKVNAVTAPHKRNRPTFRPLASSLRRLVSQRP